MSGSTGAERPWGKPSMKGYSMLYAVLAYHEETDVMSWSPVQDAKVMADLGRVHERLADRLGPAARLAPTKKARTLRGAGDGMMIDGPFAETKEQLLGFYMIDCATEDEAAEAVRDLRRANPGAVYEVRPVMLYLPGAAFPRTEA